MNQSPIVVNGMDERIIVLDVLMYGCERMSDLKHSGSELTLKLSMSNLFIVVMQEMSSYAPTAQANGPTTGRTRYSKPEDDAILAYAAVSLVCHWLLFWVEWVLRRRCVYLSQDVLWHVSLLWHRSRLSIVSIVSIYLSIYLSIYPSIATMFFPSRLCNAHAM
jgi:hypothetical protein